MRQTRTETIKIQCGKSSLRKVGELGYLRGSAETEFDLIIYIFQAQQNKKFLIFRTVDFGGLTE